MLIKINGATIAFTKHNNNLMFEHKDKTFEIISAWSEIIDYCITSRMKACENNLISNLSRLDFADDYIAVYHTEKGRKKHYSAPAMHAMQDVTDNIYKHVDRIVDSQMCLLQILKSLYWVKDCHKELILGDYSFDDLYSCILEKLTIKY